MSGMIFVGTAHGVVRVRIVGVSGTEIASVLVDPSIQFGSFRMELARLAEIPIDELRVLLGTQILTNDEVTLTTQKRK